MYDQGPYHQGAMSSSTINQMCQVSKCPSAIMPPYKWAPSLSHALGPSPRVPGLHQAINNHANHK